MRQLTIALLLTGTLALAQGGGAKAPAKGAPAKPAAAAPAAAPAAGGKLDGAKLYMEKTCVACHGKDAKTPILPNYPKIAGQNAAYALQQMKDIKSGARANGQTAAMKGIMPLVNDEEMAALAEYVSTLK